ncbi:hypothetical protein [Bradyrhizobium uaiense]|uniref:hypothetical protein n=1 Tax=Bradyrhizobium uaiense TaxID=2594946 RepID=UPI001F41BA04|nr:hypothetical protein [Bradyrhizobium uaiense]
MAAWLDACRFVPAAGGTTDWTYSTTVQGYQSPAAAGVVNGRAYKYRAESSDLTQWEMGEGTYNTSTGVLSRTTVLFNSLGTTAKVNFTAAPQVAVIALKEDLISIEEANSFTTAQQKQARQNIGADSGVFVADRNGTNQTGLTAGANNKVAFNNKVKDANGWFDAVTNYRYTPLIAGTYLVALNVATTNGTSGETCQAVIYKNGASVKVGPYMSATSAAGYQSQIVAAVAMNGSTDYLEFYVYAPAAITTLTGATTVTNVQAYRIGD